MREYERQKREREEAPRGADARPPRERRERAAGARPRRRPRAAPTRADVLPVVPSRVLGGRRVLPVRLEPAGRDRRPPGAMVGPSGRHLSDMPPRLQPGRQGVPPRRRRARARRDDHRRGQRRPPPSGKNLPDLRRPLRRDARPSAVRTAPSSCSSTEADASAALVEQRLADGDARRRPTRRRGARGLRSTMLYSGKRSRTVAMKITCQSCQAKYTIADEKVLGKIVKIRCKKCAATIVVNGSDAVRRRRLRRSDDARRRLRGDRRRRGVDRQRRRRRPADDDRRRDRRRVPGRRHRRRDVLLERRDERLAPPPRDRRARRGVQRDARGRRPSGAARAAAPTRAHGRGPAQRAAASTRPRPRRATARRTAAPPRRGAVAARPGADLFRGAAQAGGEEDVMTSAPAGMPQAHDDGAEAHRAAQREQRALLAVARSPSKGKRSAAAACRGVEALGPHRHPRSSARRWARGDDKKRAASTTS